MAHELHQPKRNCSVRMHGDRLLLHHLISHLSKKMAHELHQPKRNCSVRMHGDRLLLHHLISHLSKICSLGQSIPHLPSCVPVTVGSWTVTRPASPVAYQMFVWSVESVEHLFNCQSNTTQLTVQDLWDDPAAVADFLNLDNWRKETSRRAITTTTTDFCNNEIFSFVNANGCNFSTIFTKFGTQIAQIISKSEFICGRKRNYFVRIRSNQISMFLCYIQFFTSKNNTFHPIFTIFGDQFNSMTVRKGILFGLNWK